MLNQSTVLETAREVSLGEICTTFIDEELLAESHQTQLWYRCRLGLLARALGPERELSSITKKELLAWWHALENRTLAKPPTLSPDTFHGYVRAARRLFSWLYDQHLIVVDLAHIIKLPDIPERQRKGISDANVARILAAARHNPRDHAILRFLESTGARRGGVASLTLSDIDLDAPEPHCRRAVVHEKGKRARGVVMSHQTLAALRAWLAVRRSETDYVFVDTRPGHDAGLKPGAINQIIARYQEELGIKGQCSPHQWRHRFCREMLKRQMPLSTVQQLAGHKTVTVTAMIYGNLLMDELQAAYDATYQAPDS